MEWVVLLVAGGIFIALLWRRANDLERQLHELSDEFSRLSARLAVKQEVSDLAPPPGIQPARRIEEPAAQEPPPAEAKATAEAEVKPQAKPEPAPPKPQPVAAKAAPSAAPVTQAAPPAPRFQFDFEDIFGRRLPIWGGGIALAIAGIFLVRYSIEAGLVTPAVRVVLSFLFGVLLLGGAEAAYRFDDRVKDPRVRQALAGAGLATLFGAFYLAGTQYGLIGAGAAFIGLATVTAGAIALSFRFGLPCAILGLVGGFAAPVMVQSDSPNVPLLALYLALVTGGLSYAGRAQKRPWLGYAAMAGGLLWGFVLILGGVSAHGDVLAAGAYVVVIGSVLPAFLHADEGPSLPRLAAAGLATLQMAALVGDAGFDLLTWGLYLLLGAALAFFGWRDWRLRVGSAVAAGIALVLAAMWGAPQAREFALVAAGVAAIFAAVPLAMHWRGHARLDDLVQLALVPAALAIIAYGQFGKWDDSVQPVLALTCAMLALLPAAGAWLSWRQPDGGLRAEAVLGLMVASSAALLFAALLLVTPSWSAPIADAALALLVWQLARQRGGVTLPGLAWASAGASVLALIVTPHFFDELGRLAGNDAPVALVHAIPRWLAVTAPFLALAWSERHWVPGRVAEAVAAALLYGLAAQFLPADTLAWAAAAGAIALAWLARERCGAWAMLLMIAFFWALLPLGEWVLGCVFALAGKPMLLGDVPSWRDVALYLAPFAAGCALAGWRMTGAMERARLPLWIAGGIAGVPALHSVWKHAFALSGTARFVDLGMAERTLWEAALLLAGLAMLRLARSGAARIAAGALVAAALLHFAWFTMLLHNPLWDRQAVGALPIANWLLPAYALAGAGLLALRRQLAGGWSRVAPAMDSALMLLICLFALSSLRQGFAGSILVDTPLGQSEDLLRSLLAILVALGLLWWGARSHSRTWRIGSLVLMLLAVSKVFLVDAAGLQGLLRIASFMALGFSLIGIGWFYTRQLAGSGSGKQVSSD